MRKVKYFLSWIWRQRNLVELQCILICDLESPCDFGEQPGEVNFFSVFNGKSGLWTVLPSFQAKVFWVLSNVSFPTIPRTIMHWECLVQLSLLWFPFVCKRERLLSCFNLFYILLSPQTMGRQAEEEWGLFGLCLITWVCETKLSPFRDIAS